MSPRTTSLGLVVLGSLLLLTAASPIRLAPGGKRPKAERHVCGQTSLETPLRGSIDGHPLKDPVAKLTLVAVSEDLRKRDYALTLMERRPDEEVCGYSLKDERTLSVGLPAFAPGLYSGKRLDTVALYTQGEPTPFYEGRAKGQVELLRPEDGGQPDRLQARLSLCLRDAAGTWVEGTVEVHLCDLSL